MKTTASEVQQMLDWCEEEAALTMAKGPEGIQAEKEARRKCEEAVARELEEIAREAPLGRVWADLDWEKGGKEKTRNRRRRRRRNARMGKRETDEGQVGGGREREERGTGGT